MIIGSDSSVFISESNKLSPSDIVQLQKSTAILWIDSLSQSKIWKDLQNYKWVYITVPYASDKESSAAALPLDTIIKEIETIRNTLSEVDPQNRGLYFDNAGAYIYLLNTTQARLSDRIKQYQPIPYLTVGTDLEYFIDIFWLKKYNIKNYANLDRLSQDKKVWEIIWDNQIKYIFISEKISDSALSALTKKYGIFAYRVPELSEDTSQRGYIRLLEKIMNDFISAFDTYD